MVGPEPQPPPNGWSRAPAAPFMSWPSAPDPDLCSACRYINPLPEPTVLDKWISSFLTFQDSEHLLYRKGTVLICCS